MEDAAMRVGRLVVAVSLIAWLLPGSVSAQATKAGVVTTLEGNVTAARTTAAQPVALKFKDDVFVNDRVVTGDRSLARLLLGGKAVVTVRERSALTITEVPGRSTIDLDSGKVAVAVAKDKMRPGEQVEVKTPNAVAAVRGTVFIAEVVRATASADNAQGGTTANFYVLTGSVAVTSGAQTVNVGANNFASVTGSVVNSGVMSAAMRANATGGLSSNLPKVSGGEGNAKQTVMDTTVATFSGATLPLGSSQTTPPPPVISGSTAQTVPLTPGGNPTLILPPTPPTTASGILLFGDADMFPMVASRAALAADLAVARPGALITNLNSPTLPADLSAYKTIMYVGAFQAISAADQQTLAQFLARGGGLYLTGERQCCPALNSSVQSLLQQATGSASIRADSTRDFVSPPGSPLALPTATFNRTARGLLTAVPTVLTTWAPNGPGEMFGISGGNVLSTIGDGIVAGVWNEFDLKGTGNAGRIVVMMDVNWLSDETSLAQCDAVCRQNIVNNLITFLDDPAVPLVVTTSLFRSVNEVLGTTDSFFDFPLVTITNTSVDPLLWFSGSTLTTQGVFSRMRDANISTEGSFLRADSGAQLIQTGTNPFVAMSGGSLAVGAGNNGSLFDLAGRAGLTAIDEDTGLQVGTDRPLRPGAGAPVFDADNGAVVNVRGSAYKVDTALLEATAPLLNLKGGTSFTTGDHTINLVGSAKVSIPDDAVSAITLRSSMLTVANGHLVNVAGGSVFNIAGNLVNMVDASTVNILNGLVLNVTGGSSVTIGRSLVSFTGAGNVLNVTNSIVPTAIINGIPVAVTGGASVDSFRIGANAIAGAGTIRINGVTLTPNPAPGSITGSLVAIQGSGNVNIGAPPVNNLAPLK